jgi:hypothetical protein
MNIKEAKNQIKNAITAYFTKDEFGNFLIPIERQRPIFMIGAPGIGKTAIMEQIAGELGVALVTYSMTHHTRQSAIGLPFIVKKQYGGKEYDVSEYTMSEIIASIYDTIEETGIKEGILFLDEINCVSETLAPAMLQFLQYKIFGRHKVPEGWIVVTAGNPPEFNNSVREFDIVTWDRLKRVDVEANYDVWKEYAYAKGVHPSITTYLEIRKGDFYIVESSVDGKVFVTARGWDDLSQMIKLYETHGLKIDESLVIQYLQNKKVAKGFAIYYDLFNKYKADYQVDKILEGKQPAEIENRAKQAKFDERLSLLGLLLDGVSNSMKDVMDTEERMKNLTVILKRLLAELKAGKHNAKGLVNLEVQKMQESIANGKRAGTLSPEAERQVRLSMEWLEELQKGFGTDDSSGSAADDKLIRKCFEEKIADLTKVAKTAGDRLTNMFKFCEKVFGNDQEILILVTELTMNHHAARFISRFGNESYFTHNKELLFYERQKGMIAQLEKIEALEL